MNPLSMIDHNLISGKMREINIVFSPIKGNLL